MSISVLFTLLLFAGLLGTSAHGHDDGRAISTGCAVCQLASTTPIGVRDISTGLHPVPVLAVSDAEPPARFYSRMLQTNPPDSRAPPVPTAI